MALQFTITNVLYLMSYLSPMMLTTFMVMTSVFNQDVKGLWYLMGLMLLLPISMLMRNMVASPHEGEMNPMCRMVDIPGFDSRFDFPILSTLILGFTLAYLLIPMMYSGYNAGILMTLIMLVIMDGVINRQFKCGKLFTIISSSILGCCFGAGWFFLVNAMSPEFVYFGDVPSNRVMCQKPKANTYKCKVYKNGRLIKTT